MKIRYFVALLIVPYGIETNSGKHGNQFLNLLLIVPYGIETLWPSLGRRYG